MSSLPQSPGGGVPIRTLVALTILSLLFPLSSLAGATDPLPDLIVRDVFVPPIEAGDTLLVLAYVENLGGPASSGFRVAFALDGVVFSEQTFPAGMPGGANFTASASAWAVASGWHNATVTVDAANEVIESNETHASNVGSTMFYVPPAGPDLVAQVLSVTGARFEGEPGSAKLRFQNVGVSTTANLTVVTEIDGVAHERSNILLSGNGSTEATAAIPPLNAGVHIFRARIDTEGNVSDVNTSNNVAEATIFVAPASDLVPRIVSLAPMHVLGAPHPTRYDATVEVCNVGAARSSNGSERFSVSGATIGYHSLSRSLPDVLPGACVTRSVAFDAPGVIGAFTFGVHVGADDQVESANDHASVNGSRGVDGVGVGIVLPGGVLWAPNQIDTLGSLVQGPPTGFLAGTVVTAANATETAICRPQVCEQWTGDYGTGQLKACRAPPTSNIPANLLWTAFHPDDPRFHPIVDPLLVDLPQTGIRPCDAPAPSERFDDAVDLIVAQLDA